MPKTPYKRFVIEHRVNPTDCWKVIKRFADKDKAVQSHAMLKKHVCNLFKFSAYDKYRIYDKLTHEYIN